MVEKFRKKPLEVEAIHCTFFNRDDWWDDLVEMCDDVGLVPVFEDESYKGYEEYDYPRICFTASHGQSVLNPIHNGDYFVKGIDDSVYPVKKETFEATYIKVTGEPDFDDDNVITW